MVQQRIHECRRSRASQIAWIGTSGSSNAGYWKSLHFILCRLWGYWGSDLENKQFDNARPGSRESLVETCREVTAPSWKD